MYAQARISGNMSGQVPIQVGSQLSELPQSNGNSVPSQMQSLGDLQSTYNMGSDIGAIRHQVRGKIYQIFQKRQQLKTPELQQRLTYMAQVWEDRLYRNSVTMEEYANMNSLEPRLQSLIMHQSVNQNQKLPHSASSISTSPMMPTPGMTHSGNYNSVISSSVNNSMIPVPISGFSPGVADTVNSRSALATSTGSIGGIYGGSFSSSVGSISNGYQQPSANISISGGNNLIPTRSLQQTTSQMIPTPGSSNNNAMSEALNNTANLSGSESSVSQKPQLKQYVGGQNNSHILHNLGGKMGVGLRSSLQHNSLSYGFPNGAPNGGLGSIGNKMQLMHSPATTEGHLNASPYGCSPASPRLSTSHFEHQRQQYSMQTALSQQMIPVTSDGHGMDTGTNVGYAMNNQNFNKTTHSSDQSSKANFPSHHVLQQQMPKFQQQDLPQLAHFQRQSVENIQNQDHQNLLLRSGEHRQSQLTPSVGSQPMDGPLRYSNGEVQYSKIAEQLQLSELQNQFQQTTAAEDCSRGAQMLWDPSGQEECCSSISQNTRQEMMNQHHQLVESQNSHSFSASGVPSAALLQGQCHSQLQEKCHMPGQSSEEYHVQEELCQRIKGHEEAQRPHVLSDSPILCQTSVSRCNIKPTTSNAAVAFRLQNAIPGCKNQIRWLLFLLHARWCSAPEGKCLAVNCITAQQLLKHMDECNRDDCPYPRCINSRKLVCHYRKCRTATCPVCTQVRSYIESHRPPSKDSVRSIDGPQKSSDAEDAAPSALSTGSSTIEASQDLHSMVKRMKVEHPSPSLVPKTERSLVSVPALGQPHASEDVKSQISQHFDMPTNAKYDEFTGVNKLSTERKITCFNENKKDAFEDVCNTKLENETIIPNRPAGLAKQERMTEEKDILLPKQEADQEMSLLSADQSAVTKSGKPKIKGVSLTELFTPEEIKRHITGLRQWIGQSKAKAEKNQAMEHSMSENSCQLCAIEKLSFEPPPIYCTSCGARIKRNAMYYTTGSGDTRHYFCIPCYNEPRGDIIVVDGTLFHKVKMEKKKNDEETEEWWVQCDKCEAWQHQICALFNGRRNDGGQAEYTCPNCYIGEIERGERKPLPQSAVLGAKDLPRTILSDHIEQRVFRRLRQERQDRAKLQGKHFDEVPGAEALVVRVVSSIDKKLEVKQRFLEIFHEENYPIEFPYKSKVILLFQKIEGVEVCLFGMYVQEFGSECLFPNQRRVYLSYLDSVKYFRPEIKAVTGEALRTFVYHEILIAYLEYCKKRGFTSCYIWACPPLKGEDYILYCHPEIQKTPKSDKLREWYLAMLRKAAKENIVVDLTNLYDHFFVSTGECKAKVTAARLPYFDGDYWPGAAEDMINQLLQEEDGRKQQKKGKTKKTITKRALKAAGHTDLSGNASKDILLMQKLGETISPMKEDFIMVHLQHACTHCCYLMASGSRWVCNQCKNFQLCDKCYDAEQKLEERDRHPIYNRDKHRLHRVEVNDVPEDTKDKDEILESEFFDTRQAFLSLCQGNHYQYDTLRRAKHSSMMVLYHLHNPTAPAFVTTCYICHTDIETGQGWRCESCPDYDLCNSCYQKDGGVDHPHKLTNHPSVAERDAQNKEARQQRVLQLRKMLDLLVHASQCLFRHCQYPNCRKVKGLFRHGMQCKVRASGGCPLCKKMWYILQLHARACKESECCVPRCKDLKEHLKRLQQQSDSRRRAAVMEMMRHRAAEVAGKSG